MRHNTTDDGRTDRRTYLKTLGAGALAAGMVGVAGCVGRGSSGSGGSGSSGDENGSDGGGGDTASNGETTANIDGTAASGSGGSESISCESLKGSPKTFTEFDEPDNSSYKKTNVFSFVFDYPDTWELVNKYGEGPSGTAADRVYIGHTATKYTILGDLYYALLMTVSQLGRGESPEVLKDEATNYGSYEKAGEMSFAGEQVAYYKGILTENVIDWRVIYPYEEEWEIGGVRIDGDSEEGVQCWDTLRVVGLETLKSFRPKP